MRSRSHAPLLSLNRSLRLTRALPLCAALALALPGCPKSWSSVPAAAPDLDCRTGSPLAASGWPQWALDPGHSGTTCAQGQPLSRIVAKVPVDDNLAAEKIEMQGDILVHYQQPLVVGDDVYLSHKAGTYAACDPPGSGGPLCGPQAWAWQAWSERAFRWTAGNLLQRWEFRSDWKPPPNGPTLFGWEPVFHAAVSSNLLWVPGGGGTVYQVDRLTGVLVQKIDPFSGDSRVYVVSPIVADAQGNAYYTALSLDPIDPWGYAAPPADAAGWLVKVTPAGVSALVSFTGLVWAAPGRDDTCEVGFSQRVYPLPWPPPDQAGVPVAAPRVRCGVQRPVINAAPAIGQDGTVFLVSRAHRTERDSFIVALKPTLELKWAASLRGLLADGCGVLVPSDGGKFNCRAGALHGVDPATNAPPAGRGNDESSASPIALPGGGVLYGALTTYNGSRGHLLSFDAAGSFQASYDFGWDSTPAVFTHDGTYSVVIKDNHYNDGPFAITQLDARLRRVWQFVSTETRSCALGADGQQTCVDDHPGGFEWCVNSVAVDRLGNVYANSEDGHLYAIGPDGKLRDTIFLDLAIGAAYTPVSLDDQGRIYTQNDGLMFVIGR